MRKRVWSRLSILALAISLPCSAQVLKGSEPSVEKAPTQNHILLPSSGFAGGILTGYVLGPDNKPVANAPVSLNGGTLMGEVISEPQQKPQDQQPTSVGGPSLHTFGSPIYTDWKTTALSFCQAGPGAATPAAGTPGKPSFQWNGAPPAGGGAASPQWSGFTNQEGGFIICVGRGAKELQVSSGGDLTSEGATSILIGLDQPSVSQLPSDPPSYCGAGQHFDLNGAFARATAEQDGKVNDMAVVIAIDSTGERALSTFQCSSNLHPGLAKFSITDGTSHVREYQTHIFRVVDGALDRNQLLGGQPADFWYDVQMGSEEAGKTLCDAVTVGGPVVLTKAPAHKVTLNGDGRVRLSGKIHATHVAPGSTIPFVISLHFMECGK